MKREDNNIYIKTCREVKTRKTNFLDEIYVMKGSVWKLCSTTRKSKVIAINFNPILMPFNNCQLGVGNVWEPYLQIYPNNPFQPKHATDHNTLLYKP